MAPIIKDVKRINGYVVKDKHLDYIINVNGKGISKKLKNYLDYAKNQILIDSKYKTLKKEIENSEDWYKIRIVQPGTFVFNYYLRKKNKVHFQSRQLLCIK